MRIYVATIHHRHGEDTFLSASMKGLYAKMYGYVKENWEEFMTDEDSGKCPPIPKDHEKAIDAYFEAADDDAIGDRHEWYETDSCDVEVAAAKKPKAPKMTSTMLEIMEVIADHLTGLDELDFMDDGTEKALVVSAKAGWGMFKVTAHLCGAGEEDDYELKFKLVSVKRGKRHTDEND